MDSETMPDWSNEEVGRELSAVVNRHNIDSAIGVPDYILGDLLVETLRSFGKAKTRNDSWHTS